VPAAVGEIDAEIAGSGNVTVQSVSGNVRKQIMGSGDVTVGG
jgi:oxalate decarboxylase/phosphoglucose isomerase-like protein (cupin superfamily)